MRGNPQYWSFNLALPVRLTKVCADLTRCGTVFAGHLECPRCGSSSWTWLSSLPGFSECAQSRVERNGDRESFCEDFFRSPKPQTAWQRAIEWLRQ